MASIIYSEYPSPSISPDQVIKLVIDPRLHLLSNIYSFIIYK